MKSAILWSSASAVILPVTSKVEPSVAAPPALNVLLPMVRAPEADTIDPLSTVKSAILWSCASAVILPVTPSVFPIVTGPTISVSLNILVCPRNHAYASGDSWKMLRSALTS